MDGLKEVFTALQERIKTPVIGSIILATIAINWKAFYVLIFTKEYYENKFEYMINNTYWWSLTILPILVGFAMVWVTPRLALITANLIDKPILEKKKLEINQAHELEELKAKNKAGREQFALRDKATQAEIIASIEDDELRDDAKKAVKDSKDDLDNKANETLRGYYDTKDYLTQLYNEQKIMPENKQGGPSIQAITQDLASIDRKIIKHSRRNLFLNDEE